MPETLYRIRCYKHIRVDKEVRRDTMRKMKNVLVMEIACGLRNFRVRKGNA
jgi:hypothetical protein